MADRVTSDVGPVLPPGFSPLPRESSGARLRQLMSSGRATIAPGVSDALGARLVERVGFDMCYVTGSGIANTQFGVPDVGLVALPDVAEAARRIVDATSLPVLIDGDTGHGGPLSVMRTVRLFEQAGIAGLHIEDQTVPKRCGHFAGKELVDVDEALAKLEAAQMARSDPEFTIIMRTDARTVDGFEAAVERGRIFAAAGADAVFVESPLSVEELRRIPEEIVGVPLIANVVEGGLTPELSVRELEQLGYSVVIHANMVLRVMAKAAQSALSHLHEHGETKSLADRMLTWDERQDLVHLEQLDSLEDALRERARGRLGVEQP